LIDPSIRISEGGEGIDRSEGKYSLSPWHDTRVMRIMVMLLPVIVVPVFTPAAGQYQRCILPPPLPWAIVFAPVFLAAGQRGASRINVDIASYHRHRHARLSLSLSSSPLPVNVACQCPHCILLPPQIHAIFIVVVVIPIPVPVPVPVPAACLNHVSMMHPPAATAMCNLCC
jgi:hypothetical protein